MSTESDQSAKVQGAGGTRCTLHFCTLTTEGEKGEQVFLVFCVLAFVLGVCLALIARAYFR